MAESEHPRCHCSLINVSPDPVEDAVWVGTHVDEVEKATVVIIFCEDGLRDLPRATKREMLRIDEEMDKGGNDFAMADASGTTAAGVV